MPLASIAFCLWYKDFHFIFNFCFSFSNFLLGYNTIPRLLPYYLPIAAEGRIDGFMPFSRALGWSKMQTSLSRICIQITNSISNDGNCYTKHTSGWTSPPWVGCDTRTIFKWPLAGLRIHSLYPLQTTSALLKGFPGYDTKLHLMARLCSWRSRSMECEVPVHCYYSQVDSDAEW